MAGWDDFFSFVDKGIDLADKGANKNIDLRQRRAELRATQRSTQAPAQAAQPITNTAPSYASKTSFVQQYKRELMGVAALAGLWLIVRKQSKK